MSERRVFGKSQYVHVQFTGRVKVVLDETMIVEITKADGFHMSLEVPLACVELAETVDKREKSVGSE